MIEKFNMPDAYAYAYPSPEALAKIFEPAEPLPMPDWILQPRCAGALIMTGVDGKTWTKWI
jgi:hypothetical protein